MSVLLVRYFFSNLVNVINKRDYLIMKLKDGNEVYFKIRKNTPMKKLMAAYCGRQSVSEDAIRFLVNGQRILPDQTPNSVIISFVIILYKFDLTII